MISDLDMFPSLYKDCISSSLIVDDLGGMLNVVTFYKPHFFLNCEGLKFKRPKCVFLPKIKRLSSTVLRESLVDILIIGNFLDCSFVSESGL